MAEFKLKEPEIKFKLKEPKTKFKFKEPTFLGPVERAKLSPEQKLKLSFHESTTEKYIRNHPNIYGMYGAAKGIAEEIGKFGFFKYADPYEFEQLMKLSPKEQKLRLLKDTAETELLVGGQALAGKIGLAAKTYFPKAYEFLTKPRSLKFLSKVASKGARVMDMIGKKRVGIDKGFLDSEFFIKQFERQFTEKELNAAFFIRQGVKDPKILRKLGKEDLLPIINNPSKDLLKATKKISKYYDESFEFLEKNWGDLDFVENYVTNLWDIPANKKAEVLNYFATRNPFTLKRTIPSFEEGIKLGLKPKTTNIAELLRVYDQYKIKTVHNFNFAESLKGLVDEAGNKLMMRMDKAPSNWVLVDNPAFKMTRALGKSKKGVLLTEKVPVKIHPDIAKEVKIILDKPFSGKAANAADTVSAFVKKGVFVGSLFHYWSLGEAAMSSGIGLKSLKLFNPFRVYKQLIKGNYEIYNQMPATKKAIERGVSFGALSDVQRGRIAKSLLSLEKYTKEIPIVRSGTKGLRKANDLWDAALWDYVHNTFKLWAYEENVFRAMKSATKLAAKKGTFITPEQTVAIEKSMADLTNNTFGGQQWELNRVLGNPKTRQLLQWGFLSPDWTISVLKQAVAPAKGATMMMSGDVTKQMAGKAMTKRSALFWGKAATYWNIIAQSVNYQQTKKEYGEGRFTYDNPPGKKFRIFIGRNKDGTERYLYLGKQFLEVMHWGTDFLGIIGSKMNPVAREIWRQFSAHDPGSGYPAEWADNPSLFDKEGLKQRALSFIETPLPLTLRSYVENRPHNFMFAFATSKGMTKYRSVKLFKEAIEKGDQQAVKKIYVHTLENKIDAGMMFDVALKAATRDKLKIPYDDQVFAREIFFELEKLDPKAQKDALAVYKKRNMLTPNVIRGLLKVEQEQMNVQRQKLMLQK